MPEKTAVSSGPNRRGAKGKAGRPGGAQLFVTVFFVGLASLNPVLQTGWEVYSGDRVQWTDVFLRKPETARLRDFEQELEQRSVVRRQFQVLAQWAATTFLGSAGPQVVRGRGGWLFYRPSIDYLVQLDPADQERATSARSRSPLPLRHVVSTILQFHEQLTERGIHLLVVPVPGKPSIYPDRLTSRVPISRPGPFESPTLRLLAALRGAGVETVDLFRALSQARRSNPGVDYYLAQDTHWTPAGAYVAAEAVAERLRELNWVPDTFFERDYALRESRFEFQPDLMKMGSLTTVAAGAFPLQRGSCQQVIDTFDGRPYQSLRDEVPILLLGDSFSAIYHLDDPVGAGFVAHLAFRLQMPLEEIISAGGASTEVRRRILTEHSDYFQDKQVVIWQFVEREIAQGAYGWEKGIQLP